MFTSQASLFSFSKLSAKNWQIILDLFFLYGSKILAYLFAEITIHHRQLLEPFEGIDPVDDQIRDEQARLLEEKIKETLAKQPEAYCLRLVDPHIVHKDLLQLGIK